MKLCIPLIILLNISTVMARTPIPQSTWKASVEQKTLTITIPSTNCNIYHPKLDVAKNCREDRPFKNIATRCRINFTYTQNKMFCPRPLHFRTFEFDLVKENVAHEAETLYVQFEKSMIELNLNDVIE